RVRAAGDRRDHDRAVLELERLAAEGGGRAGRLAAVRLREQSLRLARGRAQRDAVLRALRSRDARLDGAEVERQHVRVAGARRAAAPEPLLLRVGLDQADQLRRAAGELEVAQRLAVDREDRARAAVLGRHVADRRAVRERQVIEAFAEE